MTSKKNKKYIYIYIFQKKKRKLMVDKNDKNCLELQNLISSRLY